MAPFIYFVLTGVALGVLVRWIRHEDGFGAVSDIELGILGSLIGGMTYVMVMDSPTFTVGTFLVPPVCALAMIFTLGRLTGNQRHMPR